MTPVPHPFVAGVVATVGFGLLVAYGASATGLLTLGVILYLIHLINHTDEDNTEAEPDTQVSIDEPRDLKEFQ